MDANERRQREVKMEAALLRLDLAARVKGMFPPSGLPEELVEMRERSFKISEKLARQGLALAGEAVDD